MSEQEVKTSEEQEKQLEIEFFKAARKLDSERIGELESIIEKQSSSKCAAGIDYVKHSRELGQKIAQLEIVVSYMANILSFYADYRYYRSTEPIILADEGYEANECLEKHKALVEEIRQRQQGARNENNK
jgi:hypothetical protein